MNKVCYHELTKDMLQEHAESYRETMDVLVPSMEVTTRELLSTFDRMQQQGSIVLVARDDAVGIIGTITLLIEYKMTRGGVKAGHIEEMIVRPGYQGQGVGSHLVRMAIDYATQAGCYKIIGNTRDELVPWFEQFGFDSPERMCRLYLK